MGWWRCCCAVPGASHPAVMRSSFVGCVVGKCSQVGLQSLLGIRSGQTARGPLYNLMGWELATSRPSRIYLCSLSQA